MYVITLVELLYVKPRPLINLNFFVINPRRPLHGVSTVPIPSRTLALMPIQFSSLPCLPRFLPMD